MEENIMWQEGAILVPAKKGKTVVHYWAKVYDEDNRYGRHMEWS